MFPQNPRPERNTRHQDQQSVPSARYCGSGRYRDVFDENETKHDMLVFGSVHVGAQLVGVGPEGFFMSSIMGLWVLVGL